MTPQAIFHLSFPVRSLQAAREFYCKYLGASVGRDNGDWLDILLFGHQITLHERPSEVLAPESRGVRHFGAILPWDQWQDLADTLPRLGCPLLSGPLVAHAGTGKEQGKILLCDPSDNIIEIKAYRNLSTVIGDTAARPRALKQVGGVAIQPRHRASCHCGAVELLLDLPDGIVDPRRCDCSICRRKGAVVASVPLAGLHVAKGAEHLRLYQFNTNTARHYFCAICGIYTHHQRRSNPEQYGYNVGCLEGVDPFAIPGAVPTEDGIHHPADRGRPRGQ